MYIVDSKRKLQNSVTMIALIVLCANFVNYSLSYILFENKEVSQILDINMIRKIIFGLVALALFSINKQWCRIGQIVTFMALSVLNLIDTGDTSKVMVLMTISLILMVGYGYGDRLRLSIWIIVVSAFWYGLIGFRLGEGAINVVDYAVNHTICIIFYGWSIYVIIPWVWEKRIQKKICELKKNK